MYEYANSTNVAGGGGGIGGGGGEGGGGGLEQTVPFEGPTAHFPKMLPNMLPETISASKLFSSSTQAGTDTFTCVPP